MVFWWEIVHHSPIYLLHANLRHSLLWTGTFLLSPKSQSGSVGSLINRFSLRREISRLPCWNRVYSKFEEFCQEARRVIQKSSEKGKVFPIMVNGVLVVIFGCSGMIGKEVLKALKQRNQKLKVIAAVRKLTLEYVRFCESVGLGEEDVSSGIDLDNPSSYEQILE